MCNVLVAVTCTTMGKIVFKEKHDAATCKSIAERIHEQKLESLLNKSLSEKLIRFCLAVDVDEPLIS